MLNWTIRQNPNQDLRRNSGMEDSTGMTIEFLRARLLAERSVSRIATQRADDLANRVLELEEQLKIVSLQRKKAEKATANVLSVLENHGIEFSEEIDSTSDLEVTYSESKVGNGLPKEEESSADSKMMRNHTDVVSVSELESSPLPSRSHGIELSEEIDSTSDQEVTYSESKVGNGLPKEEESSGDSKMMRNHMDGISVSELESSPLPSRSLPWKIGKDSSRSHEKKYVDSSTRRRSNFSSSTSASLERLVGKSCRRIQRRETRSADEESQIDNRTLACQHNGVDTCSEVSSTCYDVGPEVLRGNCEKQDAIILDDGPLSGDFEDQRPKSNDSNSVATHGSDKNMERTLEYQAELIGQYEEEEKAQREWEEKFKDDNYTGCILPKGVTLESKSNHYVSITSEVPNKLGSVLEALQKAKVSLEGKHGALPSMNSGTAEKTIEYSTGDRSDVLVGCSGLFRVPSGFHLETTLDRRFNSIPYTESRSTAATVLHLERRSKIPTWDPLETRPRFSSREQFLGPNLDTDLPFSSTAISDPNRHTAGLDTSIAHTSPSFLLFLDLMPRMPSNEGL